MPIRPGTSATFPKSLSELLGNVQMTLGCIDTFEFLATMRTAWYRPRLQQVPQATAFGIRW